MGVAIAAPHCARISSLLNEGTAKWSSYFLLRGMPE
jgi:hypothetical protein